MTDRLWGEIRSLLHANEIDRSRAREIALALTEGMSEERAEQLLMLVDGLTHKRGDVIIDGEWFELPSIESMTPAELDAGFKRVGPVLGRMQLWLRHNSERRWAIQQEKLKKAAIQSAARADHLSETLASITPRAQELSNTINALPGILAGIASQGDPVELIIEQAARDAGLRLLDRSGVSPGPYLQIPDRPDPRWQAPPAPIRRFVATKPIRANWTLALAPTNPDEPEDDDPND